MQPSAETTWEDVVPMQTIYEDVRSFARHMDEKLRSLITALAFLTAAGIALFVFGSNTGASDLRFDGRSLNVANFFFIVFLVSASLSLSSALVAMDPTGHRPHFLVGGRTGNSILYYESILRDPWWEADDADNTRAHLHSRLFESYRSDAYAIARRARNKVGRAQNAEALLGLAMVSLITIGITRLPEAGAGMRAWLVVICLVAFTLLPFSTYFRMRAADFPELSGKEVTASLPNTARLVAFYALPGAAAVALAVLCQFSNRAHWPFIFFAVLWIGAGRLFLYWQRGHWVGLAAAFVAFGFVGWMIHDASAFRGPRSFTFDLSHALRIVSGKRQAVVCVRIRGRAKAQVELRLSGGPTAPVTPLVVRLSPHGSSKVSFAVVQGKTYGVDARELPDPDLAHEAYTFPGTQSKVGRAPFKCPPLAAGQSVLQPAAARPPRGAG